MSKFCGMIGFVATKEDPDNPGVWGPETVERKYRGEITRLIKKSQNSSDNTNDNVTLSNELSIVADPYAQENMYAIRYVVLGGAKWEIDSVSVEYPRLKLSFGGIYNG